ncbi:MAG: CHASE domain-containing protein [Pseudomonadota bacterium]
MQRPEPDQSSPIPRAPVRRGWGPLLLAGLVCALSLLVTWLAWSGARRDTAADLAAQFDYRARDLATATVRRMAVYEQVLRGAQGFMRGSAEVDRQDFADYFRLQNLQEHFPGIEALGIAGIVAPAQLAAHEAAVRAQGFPGYQVHPEGARPLLSSITHIEPFTGRNLRAFGYDMYSEPVRRSAMAAARDSGRAALSGKVVLVQEGSNPQAGVLMYLPVYREGMPVATPEERRAAIVAWVYAPFRMNDLMRGVGGADADDLEVQIYDGAQAEPDALLFDSQGAAAWRAPRLRHTVQADISGRRWTLAIASSPAFEARLDTNRPRVIAGTGIGLACLLALVVWLLAGARRRAVHLARAMTLELRQSYERIEAEQARMHVILQNAYDAFVALDASGRITDWNARAATLFGWSAQEAIGQDAGALLLPPEARVPGTEGFAQFRASDGEPIVPGQPAELRARQRDGATLPVEIVVALLPAEVGKGASAFVRDLRPRKAAEERERLRQARLDEARTALARSQKLEAVGKLTGGVAHDFNNILHIISANVQLMLKSSEVASARSEKRLHGILAAVERGSKLASQLLAFARRQPLHPSVVHIDQLLDRMDSLLHRAAGEAVDIARSGAGGEALWPALVDPNQLENVLLNLVINARDAMDGRGKVTIRLENADANAVAADPGIVPGDYVLVAVADTGQGMPPEVMERAFEPFFTTKPEGKGTGLGLSMAHGFVKQSGGHIRLASVPGAGTTVSIYLPRCRDETGVAPPA